MNWKVTGNKAEEFTVDHDTVYETVVQVGLSDISVNKRISDGWGERGGADVNIPLHVLFSLLAECGYKVTRS